jgi:uncharacterized membrane protein
MLERKRDNEAVASVLDLKARGSRLSDDKKFRRELAATLEHAGRALQRAQKVDGKRGHKLRNGLLLATGAGAAAVAASNDDLRGKLTPARNDLRGSTAATSVVQETLELELPVATVYNQWTQFEQFPRFMDGVEEVRQLDDSRLHWVAQVGGRRVEWEAKILEQHPDRQISWASEDGRKTRGTVSFEPLGDKRTLLTLSMSYQLEGIQERLGSALGFDRRRVRGDLERSKQLIESQGSESGGWRGEISGGTATSTGKAAAPATTTSPKEGAAS